jgi:hypothetical protein
MVDNLAEALGRIQPDTGDLLGSAEAIDPDCQTQRPLGFRFSIVGLQSRAVKDLNPQSGDLRYSRQTTSNQMWFHLCRSQQRRHVALKAFQQHLLRRHLRREAQDVLLLNFNLLLLVMDHFYQAQKAQLL